MPDGIAGNMVRAGQANDMAPDEAAESAQQELLAGSDRPLRLLTVTTLYPNRENPTHGIFVENRLRHLRSSGRVELRIVAPVPWFPFDSELFGRYAALARVPRQETRHGIEITHPRYLVIPKIGMTVTPYFLYRSLRAHLKTIDYDFDLIDAHYYYPDGVAAALLARDLGKPLTITARGTDINLIPQSPRPRKMIQEAAGIADASITVCEALRQGLIDLGVPPIKVHTLRNGVDLQTFRPKDRSALRDELGLDGPTLLSVGHLIERKGHHLVIEAMAKLPTMTLLIAGSGPMRKALETLAQRLGVSERVRFLGRLAHEELPDVYGAVDALVLASSREGWANVLLEAMACGTPVVASRIWGTPEVVAQPEAGVLFEPRTADALADSVRHLMAALPERAATRRYAEGFSWDATTHGQLKLFDEVLALHARATAI